MACEKIAEPMAEGLLGTQENDRLVSELNMANVILGFGGDDILISRAASDLLDGGAGDDIFYVLPFSGTRVITGEGSDLVVIDEEISNPANLITVSDPSDEDTIRFYNPDTLLFVDVPFQLAREQILAKKPMLTELRTPEVLVGLVNIGELSGLICDEQADLVDRCFSVAVAGNNNNVYVP